MSNTKRNQHGFTLIEAVVATGVFAFVVSSILGVYVSTIQLDRKTRSERAVAQNARYIMEYLAKEIRNGTIRYAGYPSGVATGTLMLTNQANKNISFYLSGGSLVIDKGSDGVSNLNSENVRVAALNFRIAPTQTPYSAGKTVNEHPRVTVILELVSDYGVSSSEQATLNLQSTFATRTYPSR